MLSKPLNDTVCLVHTKFPGFDNINFIATRAASLTRCYARPFAVDVIETS